MKGWQVSGTIFARTGFPYTVFDYYESGLSCSEQLFREYLCGAGGLLFAQEHRAAREQPLRWPRTLANLPKY